MSSPLSVKRRRLNDATAKLAKPFVSPLRKSSTAKVPLNDNRNAANTFTYTPSTLAHTIKASSSPDTSPKKPSAQSSTVPKTRSTPVRKQPVASLTSSKRTDPALLAAQKAITSLEFQLKSTRNDIDTLTQAHKIQTSTTDTELESLAHKWKLASQSAAEELFGSVKERVQRMGGVQAWRESEKAKYDRANEFAAGQEEQVDDDADCEFDSQGEELPEDEVEWRKAQKKRATKEMEDAADIGEGIGEVEEGDGAKQVWMEPGEDDDSFTMDMMLRSLNIDLEVIGYEKDAQRWVA